MRVELRRTGILWLLVILCISCNSDYTVKKRGYFKIDLPAKAYQPFDQPGYPYAFEYPVYASVNKDTTFFEDTASPYWLNIDFPQFGGRIYISYKPIAGQNDFDSLVNDAFELAYKQHTYKASSIEPVPFTTVPGNIDGVYFTLTGNTATANQFFLTDSTRHFLRGALYFGATPNEDSLSIVNDFLRKDMEHMINSFRWKYQVE